MYSGLGIRKWFMDQTVIKHTTGAYAAMTVNGANQTGLALIVNALTGPLNVGDIITIAGVNAVNRITKQDTGQVNQFVITAPAAVGAVSLSIYPAIVPPVGGSTVQYQTVTASPANNATISVVTPASQVYRKNIVFAPEAVTMATADLELPRGVQEAARETFDGLSIRMVSQYNIMTDQFVTRLDVLYGYLWVRPEWAVAVGDAI
jgi:P22 coat protein - gene protein 5